MMPCLVRVGENDGACDICGVEKKQNLCLSEEGMQPLVSMHVTRCIRGFDLCGSLPPSSASASSLSLQLAQTAGVPPCWLL